MSSQIPPDREVDWAAARAASLRYLRAAGMVTMGLGTLFSVVGLLAGVVVVGLTERWILGGAAAASGVVAGFVVSRRGRKVLLGEPLVIEGTVARKGRQPLARGKLGKVGKKTSKEQLLLVVQITRARRLKHDDSLVDEPQRLGARTIIARGPLFERVATGETLGLLCLPSGQAIARLDDFPLSRPGDFV